MSNVLRYIKENSEYINYCEATIDREGNVYNSIPSHNEFLMKLSGKSKEEIWNIMPEYADVNSWLVSYTGNISVWYDFAVLPINYTEEQIKSLTELQNSGRISRCFEIKITNEYERCKALENNRDFELLNKMPNTEYGVFIDGRIIKDL